MIDPDQNTGENEKRNADYRTLLFSFNKVLRHDLSENISDIVRQKLEKASKLFIVSSMFGIIDQETLASIFWLDFINKESSVK